MDLFQFFSIFKFTSWVKYATNKIAHFLSFPAALLLLADSEYASSSRLAGKPKKSTLLSVQLPFLDLLNPVIANSSLISTNSKPAHATPLAAAAQKTVRTRFS
jgi:hypothetical protein